MFAKDVMTTRVITVLEDTTVEEIARMLLKWRISAMPVIDSRDQIVGIVSEGDLVRRPESDTEGRESWWLSGLLNPEERAQRYSKCRGHLAKDVMTTSVITAHEDDAVADIAAILEKHHIKRVPIVRKGKLVGMVSRANLLHGLAATQYEPVTAAGATAEPDAAAPATSFKPNDQAIRATILNTLHNDIGVSGLINVIVSKGVVHLWGGVETEAERQAVRTAAENAPNVSAVKDHISVLPAAIRHILGADKPG
jgi:CBS-domain-containing membrane protein